MANDYYTRVKAFAAGTKAKGSDVSAELDAISTGFDLLPGAAEINGANPNYVTAGGTADALTIVSPGTTLTTYNGQDGLYYSVKATLSNTGATTINVDGVGAVTLVAVDGSAPVAGSITANGIYSMTYNETVGKFIFSDEASAGLSSTASAASAAESSASASAAAASVVAAQVKVDDAQVKVDHAQDWATTAEDVLVPVASGGDGVTDYSALHHAAKAAVATNIDDNTVSTTTTYSSTKIEAEITILEGASAGIKTFTATGAITALGTVKLLADGTVEVISGSDPSSGTPAVFESATTTNTASTFDINSNKIVIGYTDGGNSSFGTAVVGTVSGDTISFGTPVVFESAAAAAISATFDSNLNKVVIAYQDQGNSNHGTAVVGTVSGTSISFGTPVVFNSAASSMIAATFDTANNKVVIAYNDTTATDVEAIVGTVSGTSISFGTMHTVYSSAPSTVNIAFDSLNGKVVVGYKSSAAYYTTVCTVSGTSLTSGVDTVITAADDTETQMVYASGLDLIVILTEQFDFTGTNPLRVFLVLARTDGTILRSVVVPQMLFASERSNYRMDYDSSNDTITVFYTDSTNSSYGTALTFTINDDYNLKIYDEVVFESANTLSISSVYDPTNGKVVVSYRDSGNSSFGTSSVYDTGDLANADFIGLAVSAATDTDPVTVTMMSGVSAGHTGLTINSDYHVLATGAITTTEAATSLRFGRAVSTTEILIGENYK